MDKKAKTFNMLKTSDAMFEHVLYKDVQKIQIKSFKYCGKKYKTIQLSCKIIQTVVVI